MWHSNTTLNRSIWGIITLLVLIGLLSAGHRTWAVIAVQFSNELPELGSIERNYALNPLTTLAHTVFGLLFMLTGPLQFIRNVRRRAPKLHRISGYIFILSSVFIGVSGILMALMFPFAGWQESLVVVVFGSLFLYFVLNGLKQVLKRNIVAHQRNMLRAFSLGIAIATIRLLGPLVELVMPESWGFDWVFATAMLLGFSLHLWLANLIGNRKIGASV